ncbi:MAG: chorismate mutase [Reyranellaceae bacterium]
MPTELDKLRRQIDEIDIALHDLVQQRTAIVERVGRAKGAGKALALRPGREALVLRRLLDRHTGTFPRGALVRLWREMIAAVTGLQGPFVVTVCVPEEQRGFWDIARDHFGVQVPMRRHTTAARVLSDIAEDAAAVGLLPLPFEGDPQPWWPGLASNEKTTPQIVARAPFFRTDNPRTEGLSALVVARLTPEASGAPDSGLDRSLLVLESPADVSRSRISAALAAVKLPGFTSAIRQEAAGGGTLYLIELPVFMIAGDPRLAALEQALATPGVRLKPLGAYAVPVDLAG